MLGAPAPVELTDTTETDATDTTEERLETNLTRLETNLQRTAEPAREPVRGKEVAGAGRWPLGRSSSAAADSAMEAVLGGQSKPAVPTQPGGAPA